MLKICSVFALSLLLACGGGDDDDDDDDDTAIDASADGIDAASAGVIPANTTTCATNANGCLEGVGNETCSIVLDAPISGTAVDVRVDGILWADTFSFIRTNAFAVQKGPEYAGYRTSASRGYTSSDASRALVDEQNTSLGFDSWAMPDQALDYPVSIRSSFDSSTTSASITVQAVGAPTSALSTTSMLAATTDALVIDLTGSEVCNVVVTTP